MSYIMSHPIIVEKFGAFYDEIPLVPSDWPVRCTLVVPSRSLLERLPNYPKAAKPEQLRGATGRGGSALACSLSGIGEAIELASACAWGDEALVEARAGALPGADYSSEVLAGFAKAQIIDSDTWNARFDGVDFVPDPIAEDASRLWIAAEDPLFGTRVWLQADAVLIGQTQALTGAEGIADTNGCALAATDTEARLGALLELVERDAVGLWWYRRLQKHPLSADVLTGEALRITGEMVAQGWQCWAFDITSDLGIPVIAAVAEHSRTGLISLGFAARMSSRAACDAAYTELAQMSFLTEAAVKTGTPRRAVAAWFRDVTRMTPPLLRDVSLAESERVMIYKLPDTRIPSESLEHCLERLRQRECRVFFVDHTRTAFDIPVWRAISPDLCTWKPRFGRRRLFGRGASERPVSQKDIDTLNPFILRV